MTHQGGKKEIQVENNFDQSEDQGRNSVGRKRAEIYVEIFSFPVSSQSSESIENLIERNDKYHDIALPKTRIFLDDNGRGETK